MNCRSWLYLFVLIVLLDANLAQAAAAVDVVDMYQYKPWDPAKPFSSKEIDEFYRQNGKLPDYVHEPVDPHHYIRPILISQGTAEEHGLAAGYVPIPCHLSEKKAQKKIERLYTIDVYDHGGEYENGEFYFGWDRNVGRLDVPRLRKRGKYFFCRLVMDYQDSEGRWQQYLNVPEGYMLSKNVQRALLQYKQALARGNPSDEVYKREAERSKKYWEELVADPIPLPHNEAAAVPDVLHSQFVPSIASVIVMNKHIEFQNMLSQKWDDPRRGCKPRIAAHSDCF